MMALSGLMDTVRDGGDLHLLAQDVQDGSSLRGTQADRVAGHGGHPRRRRCYNFVIFKELWLPGVRNEFNSGGCDFG
jgi:hypothetical protein